MTQAPLAYGYPPYNGRPRGRNPVPWLLAAAAVVVTAIIVVVVLVGGGSDDASAMDRSTARGTAEAVLDGYMDRDSSVVSAGFCGGIPEESRGFIDDMPEKPTLSIVEFEERDATAQAWVDAGSQGGGTMKLRRDDDGQWCVTDFRF